MFTMTSCRYLQYHRFVPSTLEGTNRRFLFTNNNNTRNSKRQRRLSTTKIPPYVWATLVGTTSVLTYGYISGLEEVPVSKRKRWMAVSSEVETRLGNQEYHKLLRHFSKDILPPTHRASRTVQRVGSRVGDAAIQFAARHDLHYFSSKMNTNKNITAFTYTVVRSDMANAFVLPGNHVFIMTGLFRYVHNEDELAAIIGHEMAHVLARHAGEKMSESMAKNLLVNLILLLDPSGVFASIFLPATTLLRDLPHSRQMETEADRIGIQLAAEACFDPTAAKRVFQNMTKNSNGTSNVNVEPPEFLSTHPAHESRIEHLDQWLPSATKIYQGEHYYGNGSMQQQHRCHVVRQQMKEARRIAAVSS